MKKIYLLIIIAVLGMGYFFACEKETATTQDAEVIDTVIYDSKALLDSPDRTAGDGYYDFVILGDQYKGRDGLNLFLQDAAYARNSLLNMLGSITDSAGNHIDTSRVRIHFRNAKQLNCNDNVGLAEGMTCNTGKALAAAAEVANGLFTVDRIGVFANGKRTGGADASLTIFSVGLRDHAANQTCAFYQWAFDGMMLHELGHTYIGFGHVLLPPNKMGSCTNSCCDEGIRNFLPQHQHMIVKNINAVITH